MKKILKGFIVLLMLIGIAVSISNFLGTHLNANCRNGYWEYNFGDRVCKAGGNECCTFDNEFSPY